MIGVLLVVQDVDNLSRFHHEAPVTVREERILTEEVVCERATVLLAEGTDFVLTGLSGARLGRGRSCCPRIMCKAGFASNFRSC